MSDDDLIEPCEPPVAAPATRSLRTRRRQPRGRIGDFLSLVPNRALFILLMVVIAMLLWSLTRSTMVRYLSTDPNLTDSPPDLVAGIPLIIAGLLLIAFYLQRWAEAGAIGGIALTLMSLAGRQQYSGASGAAPLALSVDAQREETLYLIGILVGLSLFLVSMSQLLRAGLPRFRLPAWPWPRRRGHRRRRHRRAPIEPAVDAPGDPAAEAASAAIASELGEGDL